MSIAIVDDAYAGYLAGPTSITLTTAWQRFKITGTLAGGQTGLWIVVRQFAGNGDNRTTGAIRLAEQTTNLSTKCRRPGTSGAERRSAEGGGGCGDCGTATQTSPPTPLTIDGRTGVGACSAEPRGFGITL